MQVLLQGGADVHHDEEMPLSIAINRSTSLPQYYHIFDTNFPRQKTDLTLSFTRGHVHLISVLVAAGADLSNQYLGLCYKSLAESLWSSSSSSSPSSSSDCIALLLSLGSSNSNARSNSHFRAMPRHETPDVVCTGRAFANFGLVLASASGACDEAVKWMTLGADVGVLVAAVLLFVVCCLLLVVYCVFIFACCLLAVPSISSTPRFIT